MDRSHGLPCLLEGAQRSLSTWVQWPLHLAGQAAEPAERERCLGLSLQLVTCNQTTHLCSWHVCQRSFSVFWDLSTLQTDGFLARVLPPWSMRTLDTAV